KFSYLMRATKRAKEIKLLDSLEEALPIAVQEVLESFPFCHSATMVIRFTDQDHKPGARSVKMRTDRNQIKDAARWPDDVELAFIDLARKYKGLFLRDSHPDLPNVIRAFLKDREWFFEAAVPLAAKGEIVGVIVLGSKIDNSLL